MNLCFLCGKILSEIDFKFILTGKNYSIANFTLRLFDGTLLYVKVYDDVADYSYRKLNCGDVIFCEAIVMSTGVFVKYIEIFTA